MFRLKKNYLDRGVDYVCRFCGKSKDAVKFSNNAHVIPQLLGNRSRISKSECNNCNSLFSHYETSLADYLGAIRTLSSINGKSGIPKFKDKKIGPNIYPHNNTINITSDLGKREIILDEEKKTFSIISQKYSFIPLNVYKALLKIGLSLIQESEIGEYFKSIEFLLCDTQEQDKYDIEFAKLFTYFIPGPFFETPEVWLFKRRTEDSLKKAHKHT